MKRNIKSLHILKSSIDVDRDPYTGCYIIDLNDDVVITFAPKENMDLSGWQINDMGVLKEYTGDWEEASDEEIKEDINRLYKVLPKYVEDSSLINEIINKIKEMCLGNSIKSSHKLRIINSDWEKIQTKTVKDYDGFTTDYTMYKNPEGQYIFMMGDTDIYGPDPDYADWECESEEEAIEWFDAYRGPGDDEIASSRRKEMKVKTIKSAKHILKSGYYNTNEHPEGGGTCDYCGAEIAPGDGYEQDFQSTQDTAAYYLFIALGGDENRAYMVVENRDNLVRWLQGADEDIDDDWVEDVIREIVSAAFNDKDGYMCSTCLEQRMKKAAEDWVAENW